MNEESRPEAASQQVDSPTDRNGIHDTAPYCRPGCAMACPVTNWVWILDDRLTLPPHWRLAWALHGLDSGKPPVPSDQYPDLLTAFIAAYGTKETIKGLRTAADTPAAHGSGVDINRFAAMADRLHRNAEAVAA